MKDLLKVAEKKIIIYSRGLIHCSICVPKGLSQKEIEEGVNMMNPTGIDSKWKIADDRFHGGTDNPSVCANNKTREHYLMVC